VVNDTITPNPSWVVDSYAAVGRWLEGRHLLASE